eukprot:199480_1
MSVNTAYYSQIIFNSNKGVLIGLKMDTLQWSDASDFDYGIAMNGEPWLSSEPTGTGTCVKISFASNIHLWDQVDCTTKRRALCNSCDGIFHKYFVSKQFELDYFGAKADCESRNTNLASFHSQRDFEEMLFLCELDVYDYGQGCWIGLNDENNEGNWVFLDGTSFIYGNNVSGAVYPWGTLSEQAQPDAKTTSQDYVRMYANDGYLLIDSETSPTKYAICNLPSELCDFVANWTVIAGLTGSMSSINCEMSVGYNGGLNIGMIMDKQYWNGNGNLLIDFLYKMDMNTREGAAGIIISDYQCSYYMIGITKNDGYYYVFLEYINSMISYKLVQQILPFSINNTLDYLLSIDIQSNGNNTLIFTISINSVQFISYAHIHNNINITMIHSGYSGYIGTFSEISTHAKSLYVSGTPLYTTQLSNCMDIISNNMHIVTSSPTPHPTTNPTINPTVYPTINPTINPTIYPSTQPTNQPTIYPTIMPTIPTMTPTKTPTETTYNPTLFPTIDPTIDPTKYPSYLPTDNPSKPIGEVVDITTTKIRNSNDDTLVSKKGIFDDMFFYILIGTIIFLICCILCLYFWFKQKKRKNICEKIEPMQRVASNTTSQLTPQFDEIHINNTLTPNGIELTTITPDGDGENEKISTQQVDNDVVDTNDTNNQDYGDEDEDDGLWDQGQQTDGYTQQ